MLLTLLPKRSIRGGVGIGGEREDNLLSGMTHEDIEMRSASTASSPTLPEPPPHLQLHRHSHHYHHPLPLPLPFALPPLPPPAVALGAGRILVQTDIEQQTEEVACGAEGGGACHGKGYSVCSAVSSRAREEKDMV